MIFFLNQNIARYNYFFFTTQGEGEFSLICTSLPHEASSSHISTSTLPVFSTAFFHQEDSKAEGDATFVMGAA